MHPLRATPDERAMAREGVRNIVLSRLEALPEPNREDLSRMIVAVRTSTPFIRKTMLERAKALPPERGGRPKLLKEESGSRSKRENLRTIVSRGRKERRDPGCRC